MWQMLAAAAIGAVSSIIGGTKSAKAIQSSSQQATGVELEMFNQSREDTAPWREAGVKAINALMGGTTYRLPKPVREDFMTTTNVLAPPTGSAGVPASKDDFDMGKGVYGQPQIQSRNVFDQEGYDKAYQNYLDSGTETIGMIEKGPGKFIPEEDPGFKFGYEEFIQNPTLKMASATGKLRSGATQKALTRYASDYASTKYDNFLSRYYDSLKPYQSMAGMGQTSASHNASNAISTGRSVGQNALTAGTARASGYTNTANAIGNAASGVGQNYLDMYFMNKYLTPAA